MSETARQRAIRINDDEEWKWSIKTPRVGVAALIESHDRSSLVFIDRKYPPYGLAFPGGFAELGETVTETARREALEETGLESLQPVGILNVTSDPFLDPRMHLIVISALFRLPKGMSEELRPGDDALKAVWRPWNSREIESEVTPRCLITLKDYRTLAGWSPVFCKLR